MAIGTLRSAYHGLIALALTVLPPYHAVPAQNLTPPGQYHTSWVGNSFGGGGARPGEGLGYPENDYGYWVQNNIGGMAVSADGTVFNAIGWDEGDRNVGLYKNGTPNRVPVAAIGGKAGTRGFNTASNAVCVDGAYFYVGSIKNLLLRFQWTPGDINSTKYLGEVALPETPRSLSCRNGKILVGYANQLELRSEGAMQQLTTYPATDVSTVLMAPDDTFWIVAGDKVRHLDVNGNDTGPALPGIGAPSALAWAKNGNLIVTDNGPAQQVLFFDVSGAPKLASTFGVKGGLYAGTPGEVAPQKLFGLRGVGEDDRGNLYVGLSYVPNALGNAFIRAFAPDGQLLWENYGTSFIDGFGFLPGSDGTVVYGRTTRWQLDLSKTAPGSEAKLVALTLDPLQYPNDPRLTSGNSVYPRLLHGTQLMYGTGQYGGGYEVFSAPPQSYILHLVARAPQHGWAWQVSDNGDLWNGDAPGRHIAYFPLKSVTNGVPVYDWQNPRLWPYPPDFDIIKNVIYDDRTDSLYLFGFLKGQYTHGMILTLGLTGRRYDGWLAGHPHLAWTNSALPQSLTMWGGKKALLPGKEVALAGDYIFIGMIKEMRQNNDPTVHIMDKKTGKIIGTLVAGPEVGNFGGWEDIVGSLQATERKDGEYLVLVEDDVHAKNILFRWKP